MQNIDKHTANAATPLDILTIIYVSHNSYSIFTESLAPLINEPEFRFIIVDNKSTDGTPILIQESFPTVDVIQQAQNIGYGRAANVGLNNTETPYALLLNPDIITTPTDIKKLLAYALEDTSNTAIWAPTTSFKDFTGTPPPEAVRWVSGSAMLFDVAKIKQLGCFDENIFLFAEETDLCERAIKAGYLINICRDIYFKHLSGKSSPTSEKTEYMRWWHFGWSQCYRMVKNGHSKIFRNPHTKYLGYRIHSFTATSKTKRAKWKAKSDGALAYIRGEKAFRPDGSPQFS